MNSSQGNVQNEKCWGGRFGTSGVGTGGNDTNRSNKSNKQVKVINYKKLQSPNSRVSLKDRQINDFIEMTFEVVDEDMQKQNELIKNANDNAKPSDWVVEEN